MKEFIETGAIMDVVLALVVIEVAALLTYWFVRRRGVPPVSLLLNVGAGASLMLALRASFTEAGWIWIAAFLVASLFFHVADLAVRWRPSERAPG